MSDNSDLGQILVNTEKRFEIYIPKPESRINWGAPSRKKDEGGPFGYPGVSIATKENVFVHADGNMVQQSIGETTVQAMGDMAHYAGGNMRVTGSKDMLVSGAVRFVAAAGAAPGPSPRGPNGAILNPVTYTNLSLHYRVDSLSVGLFEFFHGRRERPVKPHVPIGGGAPKMKAAKFNRNTTTRELALHTNLKGGFIQNTLRSLQAMYPPGIKGKVFITKNMQTIPITPKTRDDAETLAVPPLPPLKDGDPVKLLDPLLGHDSYSGGKKTPANVPFGGDNIGALKYGFGSYFSRFDPYHLYKVDSLPMKASTRMLAMMLNDLTTLRRQLDVLLSYAAVPGALAAPYMMVANAIDSAVGIVGVAAARFDEIYAPSKDWAEGDTKNAPQEIPFVGWALGLPSPGMSNEKAKLTSKPEPFDLSEHHEWTLRVEAEGAEALETTLTLGHLPAEPATLSFRAEGFESGPARTVGSTQIPAYDERGALVLEIDGDMHRFDLDSQNAGDRDAIAQTLREGLGESATVRVDGEQIVITTTVTGADIWISVLDVTDDAAERLGTAAGVEAQGKDAVPAVSDPGAVTADALLARLDPPSGATVAVKDGALVLESEKEGYGSKIAVSESLATIFPRHVDEVILPGPGFEDVDGAEAMLEPIKHWVGVIKTAPDAVMGVMGPVVNALEDVIAVTGKLQELTESAAMIAGAALPQPPESIGLLATQGITMGTQDRIVGAGGHGILFIVDGGTGQADRAKFMGGEKIVSKLLAMTPPLRVKKRQSLGFRVMSDSLVDLTGTTAAELFAMGRGLAKQPRPDGDLAPGIGIARVAGSYAAEVAGYEKVVISARSAGKDGDATGQTGGRVEMMGQTIAIGGVNDGTNGPKDFATHPLGNDAHAKSLGLSPFELEQVGGAEHLHWDHKGMYKPGGEHLKMDKYCWPEKLRTDHPPTQHVRVHSNKDALVLVGPYMVHVDAEVGVQIGMRKASPDPLVNEVDVEMPRMTVCKDSVSVVYGKDAETSTFTLEETGVTLAGGAAQAAQQGQVIAVKDSVTMKAKQSSLEVSGANGVKLAASKIEANSSGQLRIKGGIVYIN